MFAKINIIYVIVIMVLLFGYASYVHGVEIYQIYEKEDFNSHSEVLLLAGLEEYFEKIKKGAKDIADSMSDRIKGRKIDDNRETDKQELQNKKIVIEEVDYSENNVSKPTKKPISLYGLTRDQNREIQQLLTVLGYKPGPVDGLPGKGTSKAIQAFQASTDIPEDGKPSITLLKHLRESVAVLNSSLNENMLVITGVAMENSKGKKWPFTLKVKRSAKSSTGITGSINWTSLNATHSVSGEMTEKILAFKEVNYIRRGNAILGCQYTVAREKNTEIWKGNYDCKGGQSGIVLAEIHESDNTSISSKLSKNEKEGKRVEISQESEPQPIQIIGSHQKTTDRIDGPIDTSGILTTERKSEFSGAPVEPIQSSIYTLKLFSDEGWQYIEASPKERGHAVRREFYRAAGSLVPVRGTEKNLYQWINDRVFKMRVGACKDDECQNLENVKYVKFQIFQNYIGVIDVNKAFNSKYKVSHKHVSSKDAPITLRIHLEIKVDGSVSSLYEWLIHESRIKELSANFPRRFYSVAPRGSVVKELLLQSGETVFRSKINIPSLDKLPDRLYRFQLRNENESLFRTKHHLNIESIGSLSYPLALEVVLPGQIQQVVLGNVIDNTANWEVWPNNYSKKRIATSISWSLDGLSGGSNLGGITFLSPERVVVGGFVFITLLMLLLWYGKHKGLRISLLQFYLPTQPSDLVETKHCFCTHCGAQLDEVKHFCTQCGDALSK